MEDTFVACNSHFGRSPELVLEDDLCEPTRQLTQEELSRLLKDSHPEIHTRQTKRAPPLLELDGPLELELEYY